MKKIFPVLGFALLVGCASYTTEQTDTSYEKTNQVRSITTKVRASTFWSAKSELAKSAVVNTDKSQSSRVGSLSQQATNNLEQVVRIVIEKAP
jgi:outer membrane biogenesis lipoprotein LolB